ncbi:MAG: iron ABC transporter substrate-binding protein [Actinomycetia bacterium]|nr:iron ABC transporter substrate-binding protein [Actinomycetes bacterium]
MANTTRVLAATAATALLLAACGGGTTSTGTDGATSESTGTGTAESTATDTATDESTADSTDESTVTTDSTEGTDAAAGAEGTVTIYSGRNENLVGPILEDLQDATGLSVEVRYGDSAELAAQLLEEGDRTNADLFFSQDAGALGALANEGLLAPLESSLTASVLDGYVDPDQEWVATSARARVIAFDPEQAPEAEQMLSIDEILDPKYKGLVGIAPTNASFQSFVTALRVDRGEDGAREWLTELAANEPRIYEKNGAILDAVNSGEVALGLINHYYWYEKADEVGADEMAAQIHFLGTDDPGALINVAGAGILAASDNPEGAAAVIEYFLSPEGQEYFTQETSEYPVIDGVTLHEGLTPLGELQGSSVDLNQLDSLAQTLALLDEVGLT